ncbi:MAG: Ig-like domain repeat protein [Methanobacterium sp. ERen5]|nr:MAG: Ig-like domain repeat protein [Methanobacterium sp. ERen5]
MQIYNFIQTGWGSGFEVKKLINQEGGVLIKKGIIIAILLFSFLFMGAVSAASPQNQNIYVSPTGNDSSNTGASADSPYATIAKGVKDVNASRTTTLHLSEGKFIGTGNTEVLINKAHHGQGGSLTVMGAGYNKTFLDANSMDYMFDIQADSIVKFVNITFINGKSTTGGAVTNTGNVTFMDCIFSNNYATSHGGAIYSTAGNLTVSNCIFDNNSAASNAGAIYASLANISNSSITNNHASYTGAVLIYNGIISNSYFTNNYATSSQGGSISIIGSLINNTIINSTINGTSGYGGAVFIAGNSYLKNNIMANCSATYGNYIYVNGPVNANVTFADSTITTPKATVTATVTDDMGNPMYGGSIEFLLNGTSIGSANIINGTASLTYTKLFDNGLYVLNGTSYYLTNTSNMKNGAVKMNLNRTPVYLYVSPNGSDNTGDGSINNPYLTLSKAINQGFSVSYDPTIYLLQGTYLGSGNVNNTITNIGILSLIGETYNKTILDGENTNWLFNFGEYTQVKIKNLTIQNTSSSWDGFTLSTSSNLDIKDCIFQNNYGSYASIIYADGPMTTIQNLIFRDNKADGSYYAPCYVSKGVIDNSTFSNNSNVGNGGALYSNNLTLTNSKFINNTNGDTGGALFASSLISANNTFVNNHADNYGGALLSYNTNSNNDTFIGNSANNGGAVYSDGVFTNASFINNTAGTYGGAVYANKLNITKSSFTNNTAATNGNEIYIYNSGNTPGEIPNVKLIFVNNGTVNIGKITGNLTASLVDDQGNSISGGYVMFYLNGTYIGKANVVNGIANLTYIGFKNGNYNLTGKYSNSIDPVTVKGGMVNVAINETSSVNYYVSTTGNDTLGDGSSANPFATIQKAISTGLGNSRNITINLLAGVYSNLGNVNVTLPGTLNINIIGAGLNTIINGTNTNWIFNVTMGEGLITLQDLNIVKGNFSAYAGASPIMIDANSTVVLRDVNMTNCYGYNGGCLFNKGNLTVYNSNFSSNQARPIYNTGGGAIYNSPTGYLEINNSSFVNNSARYGCALTNDGVLLVKNSLFKDNFRNQKAYYTGMAIYGFGSFNIFNSNFTNNECGDVYLGIERGATGNIYNSNFYNNTATTTNCLYMGINATANVINCSFTNVYNAITLRNNLNMSVVGCLFNNSTNAFYGSNLNNVWLNVSNSAILAPVQLSGSNLNMTADYNWWGTNTKPIITGPTTLNMNYWLIMTLASDNKPGLIKNITAAINKYTDGEINYAFKGYLPVRTYNFSVSNGTIKPISGNLTGNVVNAIFNAENYGNYAVNATIDNQTMLCNFELYQANTSTTVKLSNSTGKQGHKIVITVHVTDKKTGDAVNDGEVEFFIENTSIGKVTVHDGVATKEWVIDRDKGTYQINAMYLGSDSYLTSDNFANFDVKSINTTTSINLSNSSAKYGDLITLISKVNETATGKLVNNGTVNFFNGNKLIGSSNLVNGYATFKWVSDLLIGHYNITAAYNGIGDYLTSQNSSTFNQIAYNGTQWNIYNYMNNTQIQYILNNCKNYSNIIFNKGQYNKLALTVSKPVNIKTNGTVYLVGNGSGVTWTLNSNCSIQGLIIKNYTTAVLNRVNNVTITNNTFQGNVNGIMNFGNGTGVKINTNNIIQSNKGSAIYNYGNNLTFKWFKLVNNKVGITNNGLNVDILNNNISGGQYGVMNYAKSADINYNKISGASNVGIYNKGLNSRIGHNTLVNNAYAVYNGGSSSIISYNTISGKYRGVENYANSTTIISNTIKSVTSYGIHNTGSKGNKIYNNILTGNNNGYGIYNSRTSKSTMIQGNTVSKFSYGVYEEGQNDIIKSNNFKSNKIGLNVSNFAKNTQLTSNNVYQNTNYGVYNKGYNTTISKNKITKNLKYGLATIKSVKTSKNTINGNKINTTTLK